MRKEKLTYLAAPFFNQPQLDIVKQIEWLAEKTCHNLFSPRSAGVLKKDSKNTDREEVLMANLKGLTLCTGILSVLEYALPEGHEILYCKKNLGEISYLVRQPNKYIQVQFPDIGVVWEMGVGHASGVPVYGFITEESKLKSLNVMLAHSCKGIIVGWGALALFLSGNLEVAIAWKGRVV